MKGFAQSGRTYRTETNENPAPAMLVELVGIEPTTSSLRTMVSFSFSPLFMRLFITFIAVFLGQQWDKITAQLGQAFPRSAASQMRSAD